MPERLRVVHTPPSRPRRRWTLPPGRVFAEIQAGLRYSIGGLLLLCALFVVGAFTFFCFRLSLLILNLINQHL
jgi:hypothetical protein